MVQDEVPGRKQVEAQGDHRQPSKYDIERQPITPLLLLLLHVLHHTSKPACGLGSLLCLSDTGPIALEVVRLGGVASRISGFVLGLEHRGRETR
jgi:hypothetical protein